MVIPYISREDVSAALSSLIHHTTSTPESTGLEHLLVVDLRVTAPDMPAGDDVRHFAVRELLVGEITVAVTEGRRMFELEPPDARSPLAQELIALAENIATGSHELIAWSVLYYRFVRADLSLSVERLAELLIVHTRTIARYTDEGIELLTQRLIRAEQEARRQHLRRRLYAQLPYSVPQRLIGRESLLRSAEETLAALSPRHILITGEAGIGKTVFAQELMRRQIDAGNLDHLVWLNHPGSAQFIRQQIAETLLVRPEHMLDDEQIALRDYLLLYRVAIVLDGVEAASDSAAFATLLRDLGAALVCMISQTGITTEGVISRLHLEEVGRSDVEAVVRDALRLRQALSADDRRAIAFDLYDHVGGNPLALRLAAGMLDATEDWGALESDVHGHLLDRLFERLSIDERRAWATLALYPHPVAVSDIRALWDVRPEAVGTLARLTLADQDEADAVMLVGAARDYIREQYATSVSIRSLVDSLIAGLEFHERALEVAEQVLITGFPELSPQHHREWIGRFWSAGLRRGHWARWRTIIESALQSDVSVEPHVRIAYGVCLRHLADWDGARQVFYAVVADCGHMGLFFEQAQALLEWSILARNQGDYDGALSLIEQARRYALRLRGDELLHALALREAQILIHAGKAADARRLLVELPETVQNLTLQSEALLASRDQSACRSAVTRALRLLDNDPATEASLYTIMGRSYELEGDHAQAHNYLTDAVMLFERGDDPFALARAQTNLAAVLIPMKRYHDAGTLLTRVEAIQARLGDRVGLSATRHNRTILGGYIAG